MEYLNLKSEYNDIKIEMDEAIHKVLDSGCFVGGEEVDKFEKEVATYCKTKYAISLSSGTDALFLSLIAIDVRGKEVITTPFTFVATAGAIVRAGGIPVFVDINENDFNIDTDKIEEKITQNTKAILPVHLFGKPCNMSKIMRLAKKYSIYVVEDAAQAFGSKNYDGKKIGSVGTIGAFSFYPTKNLACYGDGGMVVTNNKDLADKILLLKNHGSSPKSRYNSITVGTNSRLDSIQAAILRIKLKHLKKQIDRRRENAKYYSVYLNQLFFAKSSYNQYTIRIKNRKKLRVNFPYQIYYPKPIYLMKAFEYLGYEKGDFPVTEKASEEVISLPLLITREKQDYVVRQLRDKI